ncbi:MAG: S46 family peptidase, partial [Bacteroidota bacterium]
LRRNMDLSKETEIKYAAKYAGTSNYWKYFIGQTAGLKRLNVFDKKKELEEQFSKWIENDPDRRKFYGNVLKDFSITYDTLKDFALLRTYLNEAAFRGPDIIGYASGFARLSRMLESENRDTAAIRQEVARLLEASKDFFKDFDIYTEKELFESLMSMFYNDIDPALQPTIFEKVRTKYKGNFSKFTYYAYNESIFKGKNEVFAYLTDPRKTPLDNDPLFMTALSLSGRFRQLSTEYKAALDKLDHAKRLYLKGLMEMLPEKWFYPDANSTMRLTYGHACSYFPRDAVKYKLYTTLDGIIQKEDTCDREFLVPEKLKTLHRTKDYGPYGDNGIMYVCFITNNDITGGNSGSPVLNGKGELIGLAFDGNWEAMSGDIAFEPALQRTIVVDIRYVLFVIDKFAGASHLVKEMKLEE